MKIVVFDPGGHTGYVVCIIEDRTPRIVEYGYFFEGERIADLLEGASLCVSEKITHPGVRAFNTVGIEVMGVIKHATREKNIPLEWQSPSLMQTPLRWGIVREEQFSSEHPKDAICHLAVALRRHGFLDNPRELSHVFDVTDIPYFPSS